MNRKHPVYQMAFVAAYHRSCNQESAAQVAEDTMKAYRAECKHARDKQAAAALPVNTYVQHAEKPEYVGYIYSMTLPKDDSKPAQYDVLWVKPKDSYSLGLTADNLVVLDTETAVKLLADD